MRVTVNCSDFMTGEPVPGCDVTCEVTVAPRFVAVDDDVIIDSEEDARRPVPTLLAHDDDVRLVVGSGITLPEQRASTGEDGVVRFSIDVSAEISRLEDAHEDQPNFFDVAVLLALTGRVAGLVRTSPRILSATSAELALGEVHLQRIVLVDFAKAIVGHTTENAARLWFQLHPDPLPGRRYVCEVDESSATTSDTPLHVVPVPFDGSAANTADIDLGGLDPGRTYRYQLLLRPDDSDDPRTGQPLSAGTFRTATANPRAVTMYFGSCHKPLDTSHYDPMRDLLHWRRLARRDDADMLLLLGDQIYGDSVPPPAGSERWFDGYVRRYNALWTYQPVRDAFGNISTYMIADDHEVADDWGTDNEHLDEPRISDAKEAIRIFQLAHGPNGREGPFHYHFRRGPVAVYMTDGRTERGKHADAPILGPQQWDAIERWATSPEAVDADVIVLGCAVPPALLPVERLEDYANATAVVGGAGAGALLGAAVGAAVGPIGVGAGAAVGAVVGAAGAAIGYEVANEDLATEGDAADAWTWTTNQPDLKRLLDVAFALANDTMGGRNGQRPRLVIILGGDAHFGFMHRITSDHAGGTTDHTRNSQILQCASSAIGRHPQPSEGLRILIDKFGDEFTLDSEQGDHYRAELLGTLWERTLGRLKIERVGSGRTYQVHASIEGETTGLNHLVEVDLDGAPVRWGQMIGQVVATRGVPISLRIHEIGDAFGGFGDRLEDVEVIFQLDGEPGRWFGFALRTGADEANARGMLEVLREALNMGTPVRVAYRRTGPANGEAIRVTAYP